MGSRGQQPSTTTVQNYVLIDPKDLETKYASVVLSLAQTARRPEIDLSSRPDGALNEINRWVSNVQTAFVAVSNDLKAELASKVSSINPPITDNAVEKSLTRSLKDFVEAVYTAAGAIPKARFPDLRNQNSALLQAVEQLKTEVQKSRSSLNTSESTISNLTSENKILKGKITDLASQLEQCNQSGSQKTSDVSVCENEKSELRKAYEECRKATETLTLKLADRKQTIQNLKTEKETITTTNETTRVTTEKIIKDLRKRVKQLQQTKESCEVSHDTLDNDLKVARDHNAELESDIEQIKRKNDELQAIIQTMSPQKGTGKSSTGGSSPILASKDIENLEIVKELRRQVQELTDQLETCKRSCKEVSDHVEELNEKIEKHEEDKTSDQKELEEKDQTIKKLQKVVETQKKKKEEITQTLKDVINNVRVNSNPIVPEPSVSDGTKKPQTPTSTGKETPAVPKEEEEEEPMWKLEKISSQECSNIKECIGHFVDKEIIKNLEQIPSEIIFTINNPKKTPVDSLKVTLDDGYVTPTILNITPLLPEINKATKITLSLQPTDGNTRVSSSKSDPSKIELFVNLIEFAPNGKSPFLIKFTRKFVNSEGVEAQTLPLIANPWKTISGSSATSPQNVLEQTEESDEESSNKPEDEGKEEEGKEEQGEDEDDTNKPLEFGTPGTSLKKPKKKGQIPGKTDYKLLDDKTFQVLFTVPDEWKTTGESLSTISAQIKGANRPTIPVCNDEVMQDLLAPYMMDLGQGLIPGVQVVLNFHAYDKKSKDSLEDETLIKLLPPTLEEIKDRVDIHVHLCAKAGIALFDEDNTYIFEITIQGTQQSQYSYNAFTSSARTESNSPGSTTKPQVVTKSFPALSINKL